MLPAQLAAAFAALLTLPAEVAALPEPLALANPRGPVALSLTVAGGVSLGAYEAGQLLYMTEVLKANPGLRQLRLVTGASAGSINGLMAILALCATDPRPLGPTEGPFWNTWIPLGLGQLWGPGVNGGLQGAFSRAWAERLASEFEATWRAGLREDCDVVLGISATRVLPIDVQTPSAGLSLPRVEVTFALRLQGRGAGRPPRLVNHVSSGERWPQDLLPEGPDGEVSFAALRELVFASTAFPLAFPPQRLRHCTAVVSDGRPPRCPADQARSDLFVDGGLFDNSPVRLAARLAASGLRDDGQGGTRWLDAPGSEPSALPDRTLFAFVTPDVAAYPGSEALAGVDAGTPALKLASQVAAAFVATARAKNLLTLLEEYPSVVDRLMVPQRHLPAASEPLDAFLGFVERDFREFDYFLGLHAARHMVVDRVLPAVQRIDPRFRLRLPDDAAPATGWRPLDCLRATLGERDGAAEACAGPDLAAFRVLLQASLFRLWDQCARLPDEARLATTHPQCRAAGEHQPPPLVPHLAGAAEVEWRRQAEEGDVTHAVRLLSALGFEWRDLGVEAGEGEEALLRIRELVGDVAEDLIDRQPPQDRFVLRRAASFAANSLDYSPPRWLAWVTLGRQLELGVSRRLRVWRHSTVRLHAAVQVQGLYPALSSQQGRVAPALLAGLELRPRHLASTIWQPSLLLRAGAVLTTRDGLGSRPCQPGTQDPAACTRPLVQAGLALSALESARLQLLLDWFPAGGAGRPAIWAVSPSLGLQLAY